MTGPLAKLTIGSIDEPTLTVRAQYNPKELQIDRSIPWGGDKVRDNRPSHLRSGKPSEAEYVGGTPRTMTLELLFDRYESNYSVEPLVETLDRMACVRAPDQPDDQLRRPHHCVISWGSSSA